MTMTTSLYSQPLGIRVSRSQGIAVITQPIVSGLVRTTAPSPSGKRTDSMDASMS